MNAREFSLAVQAYNEKRQEELETIAWHAANTMNVHLDKKDRVTHYDLLGKKPPRRTLKSREDVAAYLKEKRGLLNG